MAYNIDVTPGTGKTIAADDIGGVLHQQVKIEYGADNTATPVSSANPLPVVQTGTPALPTGAATEAKQDTIIGHVDGIEGLLTTIDADTGSILTAVDGIETLLTAIDGHVDGLETSNSAIQTSVQLIDDAIYTDGSGTVTKGMAILGQDGTNPQAIKTDANGELQVDVLTMPIVAVTQSGTWDEVGINDSGNSITVDDGGTTLSIDDGAGSITVDGTVAVSGTVAVTDNAGSLTVDAPAFVRLSDGAAAITTLPVSLASVPSHAVTNAGTFAVQAAGDVAHDSADSGSPVKVGGQARTTNPTAVADADRTNFIADKLGKQVVVGSIRDLKGEQVTTITSSTTETTIVTAVASTFLDLYGLIISNTSATATKVTIRDATAGGTARVFQVPAGDMRGFMLNESAALKQGTVNNNWTATCGTSVASIEITALYVKNI